MKFKQALISIPEIAFKKSVNQLLQVRLLSLNFLESLNSSYSLLDCQSSLGTEIVPAGLIS
ncbi:hypothetical protein ACFQ2O_10940 [Pontibacter rugosus]|uniref:Uncharacterized protein n=1 Tax=Pontibacter rugosus TaxID=1745966 RepID=A0ABW3SQF7_9BACT